MSIVRVMPENIQRCWPAVAPLLELALDACPTHSIEDVRKSLLSCGSHLWVNWEGQINFAMVTEFVAYPKGLMCRMWLAGMALGTAVDWDEWRDVITEFARRNGCRWFGLLGRPGWKRRYPDATAMTLMWEEI